MPLTIGQVLINRYRIVALLGQGGFGAVYRAWDLNLSHTCALKENLDTTPEAQRQFEREAQILSGLNHPNLPRVTDHFIIPNQGQYLVMDFIEGDDLETLLAAQGGPLPEKQAISWIEQICDALDYLHAQNPPIIHRDIKPANIKITSLGKAVLVDFGIAKIYDPQLRTTVGAQAVTPGFSPFEQYGRGGVTDPRTDIYALGATLYTLLTGQEPPESIQRMNQDTLVPPENLNPALSPSIIAALQQSMALHPTGRYQRVADFKAALHHVTSHSQTRNKRSRRWIVALVVGMSLVCIGGSTWGISQVFEKVTLTEVGIVTLEASFTPRSAGYNAPLNFSWTPEITVPPSLTPEPTATWQPSTTPLPSETPTSRPTTTPHPTMPETLSLRFGKVIPWPDAAISLQNVNQLNELGYWSFSDRVMRVDFSPDGRRMGASVYNVGASVKGLVYLWDTETGNAPRVLDTASSGMGGLDFSPDGRYMAWSSWSGMVALYDLMDNAITVRPSSDGPSVNTVVFSPDSREVSWGRNNRVVQSRGLNAGTNITLLSESNDDDVEGLVYSSDGHLLAAGAAGSVYLIHMQTGAVETLNFGQFIRGIAFSPQGDQLAVTGSDGKIVVYTVGSWKTVFEATVTSRVWDVLFSADGQMLITSDSNADVKFWSLAEGRAVGGFHANTIVSALALSPDGKVLVTGDWNGLVKLWGISE